MAFVYVIFYTWTMIIR